MTQGWYYSFWLRHVPLNYSFYESLSGIEAEQERGQGRTTSRARRVYVWEYQGKFYALFHIVNIIIFCLVGI